ncbi:MAG TPA: hypothetical protein VF143_00515 [Candidatus Nanopelagicales bacterium]
MPEPAEPRPPFWRRPRWWLAWGAAIVTAVSVVGLAARQRDASEAINAVTAPGGLFRAEQARGTALAAVGQAVGLDEPCTAWLVDLGAPASAKALAVTAGRCVGLQDPATTITDEPLADARVLLATFAAVTTSDPVAPVAVPAEAVVWASMRGTDLAVLRLGSTYGELAAQGITPIAPVPPLPDGGQVLVAGVPIAGIDVVERHLRGSRCSVGAAVTVVEGPWRFTDVQPIGCGGILRGSAGSVAFNPEGRAVGMAITTTIGAGSASPEPGGGCGVGSPCQVAADGTTTSVPDTSYVVAVEPLVACFPAGAPTAGPDCTLPGIAAPS